MHGRMRAALVIVFMMLIVSDAAAQKSTISVIKGTIVDKETKEPLVSASVYFAETTIGTIAQANGYYTLTVSRPGNYELIVSMVGYEMQKIKMFVRKGKEETYNFQLSSKAVNVNAVEIEGENQSEWKRNLAIFSRKLFGYIGKPGDCNIENKEIINFKWAKDTLMAFADKPVIVINNYLGYKISISIRTFRYSTATTEQEFSYHSFFVELKPENEEQKEEWEKNREEAFYGSPVHFLWALKNDRLPDEKFKVNFVSDPFKGNVEIHQEVKDSKDLLKGEQFLDEPVYFFSGYMKILYRNSQVSYIKLKQPFFTIDSNGIADNHLPFLCAGFWADLGMANMLPSDYLPESIRKMEDVL